LIGILQTLNESYINHFLCFYAIDIQTRPLKTTTHANLFVSIQSGEYYVIVSFILIELGSHISRHNKLVTKRRHTSINDTLLMMFTY
jgi:hypothetical protein